MILPHANSEHSVRSISLRSTEPGFGVSDINVGFIASPRLSERLSWYSPLGYDLPVMKSDMIARKARRVPRLLSIVAIGLVIAFYHFQMIDQHTPLHSLHYRLNYIPILLAAIWFGRWGGGVSAGIMTAIYLPHVIFGHGRGVDTEANVFMEFVLYNIVGWVVGDLVTRRVRDQERLDRSRHLATLGEMTAGIAHEVKNPTQTIGGAIDLILQTPVSESAKDLLLTAREEVRRLDLLVRDFLALARPNPPVYVSTDLSHLITQTVERVQLGRMKSPPRFDVALPRNQQEVSCDSQQIEKALRNLIENAADAAGEGNMIRVSLTFDEASAFLLVEDEGPGVVPDQREAIFEPFKTNKSGGTGLGLPLARRIAEAHGGSLNYLSSSLGGAGFLLTIPRTGP
jgi:two-component system, NtrC family, sensor histidine kinase HydH